MADHVSLIFQGRNGMGQVDTLFAPGTRGGRVILVQRIFDSISGSSVAIQNATDWFTSDMYLTKIDQTVSGDLTDQLFLAVVELS